MLQKIFWLFVLFCILFVLSIFKVPELANSIAKIIGIPHLPEEIIKMKSTFDRIVTDIPSQKELENQYNSTLSGALELKENITDGFITTKQKIDSLRETMSGAEQTVNNLKDSYNEAKDFIDKTSEQIDEVKQIIEDTQTVIENVNKNK